MDRIGRNGGEGTGWDGMGAEWIGRIGRSGVDGIGAERIGKEWLGSAGSAGSDGNGQDRISCPCSEFSARRVSPVPRGERPTSISGETGDNDLEQFDGRTSGRPPDG